MASQVELAEILRNHFGFTKNQLNERSTWQMFEGLVNKYNHETGGDLQFQRPTFAPNSNQIVGRDTGVVNTPPPPPPPPTQTTILTEPPPNFTDVGAVQDRFQQFQGSGPDGVTLGFEDFLAQHEAFNALAPEPPVIDPAPPTTEPVAGPGIGDSVPPPTTKPYVFAPRKTETFETLPPPPLQFNTTAPVEPGSVTEDLPGGEPLKIGGNEAISGGFITPTGAPTTERTTSISPFGDSATPQLQLGGLGGQTQSLPPAQTPFTTSPTDDILGSNGGVVSGENPYGDDSFDSETSPPWLMKPTQGAFTTLPQDEQNVIEGYINASMPDWVPQSMKDQYMNSVANNPRRIQQVMSGQGIPEFSEMFGGGSVGGALKNPVLSGLEQRLLGAMAGTSTDSPEEINNLLQTYLSLQSIPQQDFFQRNFAPTAGAVSDIFNMAAQRANTPYDLPNAPDSQGGQFYEEGSDAATWMQNILGQAANLKTADLDTARTAISGKIDEEYNSQARELEASLAARGIANSSMADEQRSRLKESHARAIADAELEAIERTGAESRSNINTLSGAVDQSESQDIRRREGEFGRDQTDFSNMLNNLLTQENIAGNRLSQMQNPLAMLLSALGGVNVSPSVVPGLQTQGPPGFGQMFGQAAGGFLANLPSVFRFGSNNKTGTGG